MILVNFVGLVRIQKETASPPSPYVRWFGEDVIRG